MFKSDGDATIDFHVDKKIATISEFNTAYKQYIKKDEAFYKIEYYSGVDSLNPAIMLYPENSKIVLILSVQETSEGLILTHDIDPNYGKYLTLKRLKK